MHIYKEIKRRIIINHQLNLDLEDCGSKIFHFDAQGISSLKFSSSWAFSMESFVFIWIALMLSETMGFEISFSDLSDSDSDRASWKLDSFNASIILSYLPDHYWRK